MDTLRPCRAMKIAMVCPYDLDRPGGVQTHVKDTAEALAGLGHPVIVIAPRIAKHDAPEGAAGFAVVRVGRALSIRLAGTRYEVSMALGTERRRLRSLIEECGFDIVHYHTMWTPFLPLQVHACAGGAQVATFHDTAAKTKSGAVLRHFFRFLSPRLLARLDAAIAVSDAPMEHLRAARGARIHIVPPCTDLQRFTHVPPRPPSDGSLTILFVGRLEPRKGVMVLLQAYSRLCAQDLPLRLVIAGSGEDEPKLRRFVAQAKLANVVFRGAFAEHEKPSLYEAADIVCAPSPSGESFGIVLAEAMASGRPVVAADNTGYRTVLTGEARRFLVPPGDSVALASALRELVHHPQLRDRLGAWGRAEAMRYDCRAVVSALLKIYETAIAHAQSHLSNRSRFVRSVRR